MAGDAEDPAETAALLAALPPPCEPLDVSALDGFLCGVLLQPEPVAAAAWLPIVLHAEGRPVPPTAATEAAVESARRRHARLARAIAGRAWFDPWIYELADEAGPSDALLPWASGFALAMERFPALVADDSPALVEPLALVYRHFDAEDLEDAEALLEEIATLEAPRDLAEAVEDLVRATMLIADISRPLHAPR